MRSMRKSRAGTILKVALEAVQHTTYKCRSSLGKAVKKAYASLPKSPTKKVEVVRRLASNIGLELANCNDNISTTREVSQQHIDIIHQFYESDIVTYASPNVKDVTSNLKSKQFLIMTVAEVFKLFKEQNPEIIIGKSKFSELRPTHVMTMANLPHDQCLCLHSRKF